jgi:DNA-binding MarR family transcriptional regulator
MAFEISSGGAPLENDKNGRSADDALIRELLGRLRSGILVDEQDGEPSEAWRSPGAKAGESGAEQAMQSVRRLVRALRTGSADSERRHGLSAAKLFALRQIAAAPGQSIAEVAQRAHTTQSSVSEVVARLTELGYVVRYSSTTDRRRAELMVTPLGEAVLRRASETGQEQLTLAFDRLPRDEQTALITGLESWLRAAGLSDLAPAMLYEA